MQKQKTFQLFLLGFLVVLASLFLLTLLLQFHQQQSLEISAETARKNLANGQYDYIIDVRTESEWNEGHLPNAISIPIGTFVTDLPNKIPDTKSRILFVCKKGIRAAAVASMAQKLGYTNVHAMVGNYRELDVGNVGSPSFFT